MSRDGRYRTGWPMVLLVALVSVLGLGHVAASSAAAPAATATSAVAAVTSAGQHPDPSGGFVLPVGGAAIVLTPFRPPASRYGAGHRGVDLAVTVGAQIRAAGAGKVVFAAELAGRGVVSIDHPVGIRTTNEPVTATVKVGDQVAAGQVVGTLEVGHPSCAPASCLHWGARLPDGSYLDPMGLLTGLRVRLLPWVGS